jgi:hypothetical protein
LIVCFVNWWWSMAATDALQRSTSRTLIVMKIVIIGK